MGPQVSEGQYASVLDYIRKGIDEGATLVAGGVEPPDGLERGYFVRPTVFGNVTPEMTIAQEIYNLQVSSDMKVDLHGLWISAAKEVELAGGRKAIIIFVPFKQLSAYHKLQTKLIRELEKKFR